MELKKAIEQRASVRKFKSDPVSPADLKEIVRRSGLAPSVNNSQPWHFIAVTNRDLIRQLANQVHEKLEELFPEGKTEDVQPVKETVDKFSTFFQDSPAVIFVAMKRYSAIADQILDRVNMDHDQLNEIRNHPDIQSIGAAVENLLLSATDMGYGACWLSGIMVARDALEQRLEIQPPWHLATAIALGTPAADVSQRQKKEVDEIYTLIG